jgi:hypothetical protein
MLGRGWTVGRVMRTDLQQHMTDLYRPLLGGRVQGRALALLVALEVGVQVVYCRQR